jgi:hypothetical protein
MECKENDTLKPNYVGIVGGILAFVSLALPWWIMSISSTIMGMGISVDLSVYPYQVSMLGLGLSGLGEIGIGLWYGWVALALIVIGGLLGIVGSVKPDKAKMLAFGGALALVSIIIFAVGLQLEFLNVPSTSGVSFGLFASGSLSGGELGGSVNYSAYLSFGFWIALTAAIVMFVASKKKPVEAVVAPPPPPPPAV